MCQIPMWEGHHLNKFRTKSMVVYGMTRVHNIAIMDMLLLLGLFYLRFVLPCVLLKHVVHLS
jgi:hypothetical protein